MRELDVIERLDGMITRCLKQLLIMRGVKSSRQQPLPRQPRKLQAREKPADR
jgi:hypothetical protein